MYNSAALEMCNHDSVVIPVLEVSWELEMGSVCWRTLCLCVGTLVMCLQHLRARLSPDEQLAAEKSFALYCKPVELYNIIQRRAVKNVNFILQQESCLNIVHILFLQVIVMCKCWDTNDVRYIWQPAFIQRSLLYKIQARRKKRFGPWIHNNINVVHLCMCCSIPQLDK